MERDPLRQKIKDLLWKRGLTMKEVSDAIGRSPSYMHQFLERGTPAALNYGDSEKLAGLLGCDAGELRPCRGAEAKAADAQAAHPAGRSSRRAACRHPRDGGRGRRRRRGRQARNTPPRKRSGTCPRA